MDYLDTKGRIFDVQKYSVHDGPGIRTIVFLKGCVLRCRWCCNPESQEYRIQNMKVLGEDKVIGRDVTVREMIEEVEKDRAYYYRSGGGITLSGGECMCQADFSRDLLRAAKYFPSIRFDAVFGQRPGVPLKPDPQVVREILADTDAESGAVLYAGDSGVDMDTARAAGVRSVGVTWGFRDRAELYEHGADHVVDRPGEILELL